MSRKHKRKFNDIWANQTNIGKLFGLSAIKVGEKLIEHGLKDKTTKKATDKALEGGFAKETPLKDGTYFCMWNKHQIKLILSQEVKPLTTEQRWINEVLTRKKAIDVEYNTGSDKLACLMMDSVFDDIPQEYLPKIKAYFEQNETHGNIT